GECRAPAPRRPARPTKKARILAAWDAGERDLLRLAREVESRPSYVARVLSDAGRLHGYYDLYSATGTPVNVYGERFAGLLAFRDLEAARASLEKIDRLYHEFEAAGDRAGQHHAQVVALTGRNRARWAGKRAEAELFERWLLTH
ncbi:MAG TPA: hypothetical protein VNM66_08075, partial [Thermodesulfobacteriota bacterium]|nr:hypothetical protein [Thermodesulfobacteriota bacterium]